MWAHLCSHVEQAACTQLLPLVRRVFIASPSAPSENFCPFPRGTALQTLLVLPVHPPGLHDDSPHRSMCVQMRATRVCRRTDGGPNGRGRRCQPF
eukprot:6193560-Pleurochrysis_carterae.AAC.2